LALTQLVEDLPDKLTEAMRAANCSVSQAAGAAGVRREDVQEWLDGTARPSPVELHDLAADLGVDIAGFYTGEDPDYRRHSKVGGAVQMKDYLAQQEAKQQEHRKELPALRQWYQQHEGRPGAFLTEAGREAVAKLDRLERELGAEQTVSEEVRVQLRLEQPA
jgi:transcriptional regulator with XRE-family HTH domain